MTTTLNHPARTAPAPGLTFTGASRLVDGERVWQIAAAGRVTYHVPFPDCHAIVALRAGDLGGWIGENVRLHGSWVEQHAEVTGDSVLTRSVAGARLHDAHLVNTIHRG